MWMVPRMSFGVAATLLYFAWLPSYPTWGVDVDGLAYRLHRRMICG
jgi:hypothetical protein